MPGQRYGAGKPVYVLTSSGDLFRCRGVRLQPENIEARHNLGEVTDDGAHPCGGFAITPHVGAHIPVCRAINPISGTNWEGTGVCRISPCHKRDALRTAQMLALRYVLEHPASMRSGR